MNSAGLLITLIDPVITSHGAATTQQNLALPYIPGAFLLGAASRNYSQATDPFQMFHSGAVRFGDALPYDESDGLGFPVPLSLHREKDRADGPILNLSLERPKDGAMKRLSGHTMAPDGTQITVATLGSLKTAIDWGNGRARDGQLFHLEALAAGQRFWATIEADNEQDLSELKEQLLTSGRNRLGRSRSAEFGRVELEWVDAPAAPAIATAGDAKLIWAISDLALDPDMRDLAAALGIEGQIKQDSCFYRLRDVWPFNGHWQTRGIVRTVVERGSVIAVENCTLKPGVHVVGQHREIGCGRVIVEPKLLSGAELVKSGKILGAPKRESAAIAGTTPTFALLKTRAEQLAPEDRVEKARASLIALGRLYKRAAAIAGSEEGWIGPGPTQWGAIEAEIQARGHEASLFEGDKSTARAGDRDWETQCGDQSFRDWLIKEWSDAENDPGRVQLIAKAARSGVADLREGRDWRVRL